LLPLEYCYAVHSRNGTRVGCGVIEKVKYNDVKKNILTSSTSGLDNSGVTSQVTVYNVNDGTVCYFGLANNLEPKLRSYLNPDWVGTNCNFTNGCGVHVYNGTSCSIRDGHRYNPAVVRKDPWLNSMYHSTNKLGSAYFTGCVETGVVGSFENRAFVVHSNNGTPVSCGLLTSNVIIPPAPVPVSTPVQVPAPVRVPVPVSAPVRVPVPVPAPVRVPVPVPTPVRVPVPVPAPVRVPVPVPAPLRVPVPVPTPVRAPVPVTRSTP
jgi:hypothetical protein